MIRVLHSVSNMDRAGIETMLMNYYRHIDRERVQFDFLCNKEKPGAYDEDITALGGRIFHTPGLNPIKYPQYLKYMKKLFNEHPEYKIIEAHNGALGVYALHGAKVNAIPVRIFHAHGASITKDWKAPLKLACKAKLASNINERFSCGEAAAEFYFGQKAVKDANYTIIPNAIELNRFVYSKEIRGKIRSEYGLDGMHVIGHIGRFMKQKNHSFLLEVFSALSKDDPLARLVLLGDGELMEGVKSKARTMGVIDKILFIGNVTNANEWYQAFDCFILPSIWEGLPVVGVEAQAAGLPCIFSDSVTKEIGLTPDATFIGLNAPKAEWVNAVKKALNSKERRDNSALLAEKGYDIEREAIKLQQRYIKLEGGAI